MVPVAPEFDKSECRTSSGRSNEFSPIRVENSRGVELSISGSASWTGAHRRTPVTMANSLTNLVIVDDQLAKSEV